MGEVTIASTSDTPNQVREALGLPAVDSPPNPGQDPFIASAEITKTEQTTTVTDTTPPVTPPAEEAAGDDDSDDDDLDASAVSEAGRTLAKARSAQGRINRMRFEQADLKNKLSAKDAETLELRARLEALESGKLTVNPNPPATPPADAPPATPETPAPTSTFADPRPKSDDFTDYEEYEAAKDDWLVRKVNFERDQKEAASEAKRAAAVEAARQQAAVDAGIREAQQLWETRKAKAKERFPDFDEVFKSAAHMPIEKDAIVALQHSDQVAELTYYFATHPEEVERINKLTAPGAIWAEIGRLEVKLELGLIGGATDTPASAARPVNGRVPVSNAPAPVQRVGAGGSVASTSKDPGQMSHAEYKAYRAAGGT